MIAPSCLYVSSPPSGARPLPPVVRPDADGRENAPTKALSYIAC